MEIEKNGAVTSNIRVRLPKIILFSDNAVNVPVIIFSLYT